MCFLKGSRGGKKKAHPAPGITARAAATGLSAEAAKVPREGGASANSNRARSLPSVGRPCGPTLGFLRARCSWSALNKGNGNVRATVNSPGLLLSAGRSQSKQKQTPPQTQRIVFSHRPPGPNFPRNYKESTK